MNNHLRAQAWQRFLDKQQPRAKIPLSHIVILWAIAIALAAYLVYGG